MAEDRVRLTNARVADLKNDTPKAIWIFDDKTPGFAVTVSPQGKRVFYFVGRVRGRPARLKLGVFPGLTADQARKACTQYLGEVATGKDILHRRQTGRSTVADLWGHYFLTYAQPRKRTASKDERLWERFIRPELGGRRLQEVDRTDVEQFVATIERENGKGPARQTRAILSKMYEVGIASRWCEVNPVRGTYRPDFDPRQRYLKIEEVTAFFDAVDSLRSPDARDYFRMLLYTGARRSNVGSMEWAELDFSAGLWCIPASKYKSKKPHLVPLSELALEVLHKRRERRRDGCKWVFPGRGVKGYYCDPKDSWERIRQVSGIDDLRIHDLRRSLGAWQQAGGTSLRTIQQTLGHSNIETTAKFYSPLELAQVKASVDETLARTLKAAGRATE